MVSVGMGLTVMEKLTGVPVQLASAGVTSNTPVCGVPRLDGVSKLRFPLPLGSSPMARLLFVQVKLVPGVPVKFTKTGSSAQTTRLEGVTIVGSGRISRFTGVLPELTQPVRVSLLSA